MPWKETEPMTERERFVMLAQTGRFTISDLCTDFGISRKTGHKYLQRYEAEGRQGLMDRSRRPDTCPFSTLEGVQRLVLLERRKHPTWGPKKIHDLLLKVHGVANRPHINTNSRRGQTMVIGVYHHSSFNLLTFVGCPMFNRLAVHPFFAVVSLRNFFTISTFHFAPFKSCFTSVSVFFKRFISRFTNASCRDNFISW